MGADVARAVTGLPILSRSRASVQETSVRMADGTAFIDGEAYARFPERRAIEAQTAIIAAGKKLSKEEQAKREKNGLDMWDEIELRAQSNQFPKGTDVFLTKFHGLFYVAPAQDSFMCRMRLPGGVLRGWQLRGLADLSARAAGGFLDITTRANLQLREIPASMPMEVLYGLRELDIMTLGSGSDNIRNCTASPLSGIDDHELIETIPLAKRMHHSILNHREMYGLPRKFNIAFDGGGRVSALDDTNDIGFHAVAVPQSGASDELPAGVYFQLTLGGITGHQDFARCTGVLLKPEECVRVALAIVRVFISSGDRTDRNRARLKYVLDRWGFEKFLAEVETELGFALRRVDESRWVKADCEDRFAHVGFHSQRQPGLVYVGLVLPVGRLTSEQAQGIADIADRYGAGEVRLTVWQNLIIPSIDQQHVENVKRELGRIDIGYEASSFRAGLIACTGNAGCKFAASDTKSHALKIAEYLQARHILDQPINIHLTGCHHSCAQHYIGDIGLIACKVEQGEEMVEGYHIHIGGGWGPRQGIAKLLIESVAFEEVPPLLSAIVAGYLEARGCDEDFASFVTRKSMVELKEMTLLFSDGAG